MDAVQRAANQRKLHMTLGSLPEKHLFLVGRDGLVGSVLGLLGGYGTSLFHGRKGCPLQLIALMAELLLIFSNRFRGMCHFNRSF